MATRRKSKRATALANVLPTDEKQYRIGTSKYEPDWQLPAILKVMAYGGSQTEAAAAIGINRLTFLRWKNDPTKQDFQDTVEFGLTLCETWWEQTGRAAACGAIPGFSAAAWVFNMKNRFNWADKTETKIDQTISANVTLNDRVAQVVRTPEGREESRKLFKLIHSLDDKNKS